MTAEDTAPITALLDLMRRLRDPVDGCPWDIEQSFETIAPCTIEEAYEVAEAVRLKDMAALKEELGDLLLQVVFQSRIAEESGHFNFDDVTRAITDKMIGRHPHIFGSTDSAASTSADVVALWDNIKDDEKKKKGLVKNSLLDDVPLALPAVMRAQKIQKRAGRIGFEWDNVADAFDKLVEETNEAKSAITAQDKENLHEEIGDMLFCVVNIGRMLDVDCEQALRDSNTKFSTRFMGMEDRARAQGRKLEDLSFDEKETLWLDEKAKEKARKKA